MRRATKVALSLAFAIFTVVVPILADEPRSGHTDWGPWSFDWEVRDGAGLAIRNVYFQNELVLYKATNPVTRVKYLKDGCGRTLQDLVRYISGDCGAGPFADHITWDTLVPIPNTPPPPGGAPNPKVYQTTYQIGQINWLEIGVDAAQNLGGYELYQAWYLSEDGQVQAHMSSRGLIANVNHTHHPYWRLDFDIKEACNNEIFVCTARSIGPEHQPQAVGKLEYDCHEYTHERNDVKSEGRFWLVRHGPTGHGALVIPGDTDGKADDWSSLDMGARLYDYKQDQPWPFDGGELGYNDGKDIQETDVVLWYVSHLFHDVSQGGIVWHSSGPTIVVQHALPLVDQGPLP